MTGWVDYLNQGFLNQHNTRLVGGFDEPFYRAAKPGCPAEVQYTRDYERSALHELGHWCIAGDARRLLDDYGYWYEPDGRSDEQQRLFFDVEARPQAIEKHFCQALAIPFDVSADNLANHSMDGLNGFRLRVNAQYRTYLTRGFPRRAIEIVSCLANWHRGHSGKSAA